MIFEQQKIKRNQKNPQRKENRMKNNERFYYVLLQLCIFILTMFPKEII